MKLLDILKLFDPETWVNITTHMYYKEIYAKSLDISGKVKDIMKHDDLDFYVESISADDKKGVVNIILIHRRGKKLKKDWDQPDENYLKSIGIRK